MSDEQFTRELEGIERSRRCGLFIFALSAVLLVCSVPLIIMGEGGPIGWTLFGVSWIIEIVAWSIFASARRRRAFLVLSRCHPVPVFVQQQPHVQYVVPVNQGGQMVYSSTPYYANYTTQMPAPQMVATPLQAGGAFPGQTYDAAPPPYAQYAHFSAQKPNVPGQSASTPQYQ